MDFLEGKKTYIVAIAAILAIVADTIPGIDVPQLNVDGNVAEYLVALVLVITTRAGITKSGQS